jgi:hypothetical protein
MPRNSQDFALGLRETTATATPIFTDANGNAAQPRVIKRLERLTVVKPPQPLTTRLMIQSLTVSGKPLLYTAVPTLTNALAGSYTKGFPGGFLYPDAQVDAENILAVLCGPTTPLELEFVWSTAHTLHGMIGTDDVPPELLAAEEANVMAGRRVGEPFWGLAVGECQQANANTAEIVTYTFTSPQRLDLSRLCVDFFKSNGAAYVEGECLLSAIRLAGDPLLATTVPVDVSLLGPLATDEDGLRIGHTVDTTTKIELDFNVAALGAGVSGIIQVGFFADPAAPG